jgi:cyclopropane fatty-acyl-phospholipid synthase-like methyltransferase
MYYIYIVYSRTLSYAYFKQHRMRNGRMIMRNEFGRMWMEVMNYIKALFCHLIFVWQKENIEVVGHCGYSARNLFEW